MSEEVEGEVPTNVEEVEGEGEGGQEPLPYAWKLVENNEIKALIHLIKNSKSSESSGEGEEEEEEEEGEGNDNKEKIPTLEEILQTPHPLSGESLLLWATLNQQSKVIEKIMTATKSLSICPIREQKELQIYEAWEKERAKRERKRLREERKRLRAEQGGEDEEEEEEEEEEPEEEEEEGEDGAPKVKKTPDEKFIAKLSQQLAEAPAGGEEEEEGEGKAPEGFSTLKIAEIMQTGLYQPFTGGIYDRTGKGQMIYLNGDVYVGEYVKNQKHGWGTYRYKAGGYYTGEWNRNQKFGKGVQVYPDGSSYQGDFAFNLREGFGTYKYVNGDIYIGDFKENKKHGYGIFKFAADQTTYDGFWSEGRFTSGTWKLQNGTIYEGNFRDSEPSGSGKFVFPHLVFEQQGVVKQQHWNGSTVRRIEEKERKQALEDAANRPVPVFLVVGASGVGKDTLLNAIKEKIGGDYAIARRVITRSENDVVQGEQYEYLDDAAFESQKASFLIHWNAHSNSYGLRAAPIIRAIQNQRMPILNVSRACIDELSTVIKEKCPNAEIRVILVETSLDTVRERLVSRGRETEEEIEERLSRNKDLSNVIREREGVLLVDNSGSIEEGVDALSKTLIA